VLDLENFKLLPAIIVLHNCRLMITAIFLHKSGKNWGFGLGFVRLGLVSLGLVFNIHHSDVSTTISQ